MLNRNQFGKQLSFGEDHLHGMDFRDQEHEGNRLARADAALHALRASSVEDLVDTAWALGNTKIPLNHFRQMETRPLNIGSHDHEGLSPSGHKKGGQYDSDTHSMTIADYDDRTGSPLSDEVRSAAAVHEFGHAMHFLQAPGVGSRRIGLNTLAQAATNGNLREDDVQHILANAEGVADGYAATHRDVKALYDYRDIGAFRGPTEATYESARARSEAGERVPLLPERDWVAPVHKIVHGMQIPGGPREGTYEQQKLF